MFCDFFNPKEQSYCKRLKVLCPEHTVDPKIGDDEVIIATYACKSFFGYGTILF